ncbi:MAG: hypothetical protein Q8L39_01450 [Burkholderiales bacterium]|nr:hypothetical protein [Burkholderiales bacterium]
MPYKRKAHVLFVGSGEVCRALLAATFANSMGSAWMEARAVALHEAPLPTKPSCVLAGADLPDQTLHCLDQKNIEWADLVVTLDEAADLACPPLPESVQKRCYPFPPPENSEDWRRVRDAIQKRVEGMIGGMRMMSRSA